MKRLLKKLGFRKMDEMEQSILFRAQRNAYLFLTAALVVWTFYESGRVYRYHTPLNLTPCLLLAIAVLIQAFTQLILTRQAVKDDTDSCETGPLAGLVTLVCITAGVLAVVVTAFVLLGVRT